MQIVIVLCCHVRREIRHHSDHVRELLRIEQSSQCVQGQLELLTGRGRSLTEPAGPPVLCDRIVDTDSI